MTDPGDLPEKLTLTEALVVALLERPASRASLAPHRLRQARDAVVARVNESGPGTAFALTMGSALPRATVVEAIERVQRGGRVDIFALPGESQRLMLSAFELAPGDIVRIDGRDRRIRMLGGRDDVRIVSVDADGGKLTTVLAPDTVVHVVRPAPKETS